MKRTHHNVEFVVETGAGVEWHWVGYPKDEHVNGGDPIRGTTIGTEEEAIEACKSAIDGSCDDGKSP